MICSPEQISSCISAEAMQHSSTIATATGIEKGHPRINIWTNLVDLASSMPYTKIQPHSFLGSGENF